MSSRLRQLMPDVSVVPELKLPGTASKKSRRRRVLERIGRFASSPSLDRAGSKSLEEDPKLAKQTVSCISLSSGSGSDVMMTPPSTAREAFIVQQSRASESSLELFVECEEGPAPQMQERLRPGWESLPYEVRMGVLQWLGPTELVKCSSVSKEWNKLCFDGQLWQTLDASQFYNRIPVDQLAQLIVSAGPFVRHLNLRGCVQLQKDWRVDVVANACRNLYSASLEGCQFDRRIVHFVMTRNPQLVHLNLSGLAAVTNSTCRILAQSCPQVETLNISFCTGADGRGLRKIVQGCKRLRELKAGELHISDPGLMIALFQSNMLEKLHFGDCTGLTDELVRMLVEGGVPDIDPFTNKSTAPPRKLMHLDLGKCTGLTDAALRHLGENVPFLEKLELGCVPALTDAGLAAILPHVPRLTHLDLEECVELTNATLSSIANSPAAKTLVHLQVSYCETMDDTGMTELLRKCEVLRNLEMDNTRVSDLTLTEAAQVVRERSPAHSRPVTSDPASRVALRIVVFDCSNVTWTGLREILARNAESADEDRSKPGLVQLKCFYEYQRAVDEHMRLILHDDVAKATRLESKWAEAMMANEEAGAAGRRRRNLVGWGDDGHTGGHHRRRGRSGMCAVM
ncbi:hypothetical protein EDC01DRAFT_420136 [Geopyxis carbonaria]|nr:hypothetical protein EDC01DRAFT_420136 [Geopyxis carbonaria]